MCEHKRCQKIYDSDRESSDGMAVADYECLDCHERFVAEPWGGSLLKRDDLAVVAIDNAP